ncbi:hypothetical protein DCC39_12085 [Pueribacillus theae]|uniref:Uncharacterized protein n=1 Tax=Pueribacillus theae TaxID=2171751 RepID=A0A2U1JXT3_9BACI|nr:hypothetical protein [Pueribacillus theae]PWA10020.1 hypothetical protein DCC39_12085 [Pueribacillus theae]
MKKIDFSDLNNWIDRKKNETDRAILKSKSKKRSIRTRPRHPDEIKILDELCIKRWKKAEQEGKIKYLSKRVWYYELD